MRPANEPLAAECRCLMLSIQHLHRSPGGPPTLRRPGAEADRPAGQETYRRNLLPAPQDRYAELGTVIQSGNGSLWNYVQPSLSFVVFTIVQAGCRRSRLPAPSPNPPPSHPSARACANPL